MEGECDRDHQGALDQLAGSGLGQVRLFHHEDGPEDGEEPCEDSAPFFRGLLCPIQERLSDVGGGFSEGPFDAPVERLNLMASDLQHVR